MSWPSSAGLSPTSSQHPQRILFVAHTHPRLTSGGGEIAAYEAFQQALGHGNEAWFLSSNGGRHGIKPGVTFQQPYGPREWLYAGRVYDPFRHSNPDPAFERDFGALLTSLRPDVVHFHHFLGSGVEALLYVRRYAPQARIILTLHEYLLICFHHGQMVKRPGFELCYAASPQDCHRCFPERDLRSFALRELWLKRFLREVDEFVAPSEFLRRRFIEWGLPPEKIVARENTLPRRDPPRPRDAGSSEVLRTAFFGQLSPVKGLEVFVRAAKLAEKQDLPISFRIYGSDANQPAAFQAKVRDILSDVPTNLSLGGPYRNEDVVSLMAENDVVVVPSIWWENSPVTIQEARLAGCAILGSDIGGVKEKVEASDRGRTFRTGDAYDLVAKLQEMLS